MTIPKTAKGLIDSPHGRSADDVLAALEVSVIAGLSEHEADRRLQHYGPNTIGGRQRVGVLAILIRQFRAAVGIARGGGVLTILGGGDDADRPCVRLLTGEDGTGPEADAARASAGAVLHDISLAAARQHTQPEAGEFVVPASEGCELFPHIASTTRHLTAAVPQKRMG